MVKPTAGITGVMDPQVTKIAKQLEAAKMFKPTALTPASIEAQRAMLRGLPGMAATDYQKQLQKSKDLSKLNLLLGISQAGFNYAGAPRKRGESEFSVASRALLSPLLPQVSKFATDVKSAELAAAKAKRDEERALTQGALTLQQTEAARLDKARDARQKLAFSLAEKNYKPIGKGWQYKDTDGTFKSFYGYQADNKLTNEVETYRLDKTGKPVLITSEIKEAPDATKKLKNQVSDTGWVVKTDGTEKEQRATRIYDPNDDTIKVVLTDGMGLVRTSGTNPPYTWSRSDPKSGSSKGKITSVKKTAQFLARRPDGKGGFKTVLQSVPVERIQRDDPETLKRSFGPQLFRVNSEIPIQVDHPTEKGKDGKPLKTNPVEGVHFTLSPFDNLDTPTTEKFYLRKDLSTNEVSAAQAKLGKVRPGELVSRRVYRDKNTKQVRLSQYDAQGTITGLTPDEANKWLTEKSDQDDGKGKALSTTPIELTTKGGEIRKVVLYEFGPGDIGLYDLDTKTRLDSDKAKDAWRTIPEDKRWQILKPVFDQALKAAIERRQNLDADTLAALKKQTLTTADLKRLTNLKDDASLGKVVSDIVSSRVSAILNRPKPAAAVSSQTVLPPHLTQRYPRIEILTSPSGATRDSLVSPFIFHPWRSGAEVSPNKRIMLGTGSHKGFRSIPETELDRASKNWPSIKADIENFYPELVLDDREEKILAFTGLWKNLPSMAKKEKAISFNPQQWRTAFNKAAQNYDAAGGAFKSASEVDSGVKNRSLQQVLDANADGMRDNALMSRYQDVGGAFSLTGNWLAEFRGTGLGELWEWATINGKDVQVPTTKWEKFLKPDNQLTARERTAKNKVIEIFNAKNETGSRIGTNEFERAAEYLAALARYRIRAFDMIPDARPSDKDIEIFLKAFVGDRDSKTVIFQRLSELQNEHANEASRLINNNLNRVAFSANTVVDLEHTALALERAAIRDVDMGQGSSRSKQQAENYRRAAGKYRLAAKKIAGKIIPGRRNGAVSPLSKTVDEETTANLYSRLQAAALRVFPNMSPKDAIQEFLKKGYNLVEFRGSFERGRTPSAVQGIIERDQSVTINP